jgi:hypothetical protein
MTAWHRTAGEIRSGPCGAEVKNSAAAKVHDNIGEKEKRSLFGSN